MRLLFIDIDTLRADHLGCAGYGRDTTPNIDALAAGGVHLTNVFASDLPCLPSRTALCTGRFGIRNGVVNHGGLAADLRPTGRDRGFVSAELIGTLAGTFFLAGHRTATISCFPLRHSAPWWTAGFQEALNPMRNMGLERADEVAPHAVDWLERHGHEDDWFLHVHTWDPHTPYRTPAAYGDPFAGQPLPAWLTEDVRRQHWLRPGPHSAQEVAGWSPDELANWPRQPGAAASMDDVRAIIDGYDTGVRFADRLVGQLVETLGRLGLDDETAIYVSSDHGEQLGELGVYCDHLAADEATAHIPAVLRWPGLAPMVDGTLHYHLDVAATLVQLAGHEPPPWWDGVGFAEALRAGSPSGRDALVLSQGAWTCQRAVRTPHHLYLRTWHDAYHCWPDEMLFDIVADPHEQHDLAAADPTGRARLAGVLDAWTQANLERTGQPDPLQTVLDEGGPWHCRGHLPAYLDRLRATGRSAYADEIEARHASELVDA